MTAGSPTRSAAQFRALRRTRRGRKALLVALSIEAVLVVPQALIMATLGLEAAQGLVWPLGLPMLVLSLIVSVLALVALVIAVTDAVARRVTAAPAVRRIVGSAALPFSRRSRSSQSRCWLWSGSAAAPDAPAISATPNGQTETDPRCDRRPCRTHSRKAPYRGLAGRPWPSSAAPRLGSR